MGNDHVCIYTHLLYKLRLENACSAAVWQDVPAGLACMLQVLVQTRKPGLAAVVPGQSRPREAQGSTPKLLSVSREPACSLLPEAPVNNIQR